MRKSFGHGPTSFVPDKTQPEYGTHRAAEKPRGRLPVA
jgi:hypothetical protein